MKNIFENRLVKWFLIGLGSLAVLIILFNMIIMPWYVSGREVVIPKVVGMDEKQAESLLSDSDLEAVVGGERYNEKFPKGAVIFQKPAAGATVKEGRRVFLFISSGVPLVKVPSLKGRNLRDAKLALERIELSLGDTTMVQSQSPRGIIIDQQYYEGTEVQKGSRINITLSAGQQTAGVTIPDLLGKSLSEAEEILKENKLTLGKVNYQPSFSLLPNTVIDQYPSKDATVQEGATVDLFVTKNVSTPEEGESAK
ncbi:MAG: PASTA domain-containing protein [Bacteroidota bacterium]|jgi:serine/threonine-protein kinase|nr:PASTA domain-containing protein [Ignavibacteria bacterium]MCU7500768.1 PASTA domain-containing protein [Ignavibacteria bacterium]MCU7514278.1 PASTA domain-containing protein [Ignavibacteria bacterium]MCU7522408.1 PASTA domain-containing protein [Ignavibacteria bacterium]MCU7525589.1 PASTA domain-containing protein [Ignavibacteria bacterium]